MKIKQLLVEKEYSDIRTVEVYYVEITANKGDSTARHIFEFADETEAERFLSTLKSQKRDGYAFLKAVLLDIDGRIIAKLPIGYKNLKI